MSVEITCSLNMKTFEIRIIKSLMAERKRHYETLLVPGGGGGLN
jgi:hypothetical protein